MNCKRVLAAITFSIVLFYFICPGFANELAGNSSWSWAALDSDSASESGNSDMGINQTESVNSAMTITEWNDLSEKEQIKRVQELLCARGYLYGQADGVIGVQTRSAIIKYKQYNELYPINDIVDYKLYSSIFNDRRNARDNEALNVEVYELWYEAVEKTENRGDLYDNMLILIEGYEYYKGEGMTGTKSFAEYKEMVIPEGYDEEEYLRALNKYFTTDDTGFWNFIRAISERTDGRLIEYREEGEWINWTIYSNNPFALQMICMASELSTQHTIMVLGKILDYASEYDPDPWEITDPR